MLILGLGIARRGVNIDLYSGHEHLMLLLMSILSKCIKPDYIENYIDKIKLIVNNKDNFLDMIGINIVVEYMSS